MSRAGGFYVTSRGFDVTNIAGETVTCRGMGFYVTCRIILCQCRGILCHEQDYSMLRAGGSMSRAGDPLSRA